MLKQPVWRSAAALIVTATLGLAAPGRAGAFFQSTQVEGVIGTDISGIWLAVYYTMPTFRVRLDTVEKTVAPFDVRPLSKELAPLFGGRFKGVEIASFSDPTVSRKYGLFEGDVITKLNAIEIDGVEDFRKALKEVEAKWFLITVRRPKLLRSRAQVVKISYEAAPAEGEESSEIGRETIRFDVLDGVLPFADAVSEAERAHKIFQPTAEQVHALADQWYRLPAPERPVFVRGQHRIVSSSEYDASLRKDYNTRDALFAIVSTLDGNPMLGGGKTIAVYGVRKVAADRIEGTYVETTMANAPFPIAIEFHGAFRMVRVAPFSNRDIEYRNARAREQEQREYEKVEVAPDIPPETLSDEE